LKLASATDVRYFSKINVGAKIFILDYKAPIDAVLTVCDKELDNCWDGRSWLKADMDLNM